MSPPRPLRMRRSRAKGWNLQAASFAANGLLGQAVTRPAAFGNPFTKGGWFRVGARGEAWRWQWCAPEIAKYDDRFVLITDNATAVALYETMLDRHGPPRGIGELVNHNLFCFCRLCARHAVTGKPLDEDCAECEPCHVDPLGKRVLAMMCEELSTPSARKKFAKSSPTNERQ